MLRRIATFSYRRRRFVVGAWILALIGISVLGQVAGGTLLKTFSLPGTESQWERGYFQEVQTAAAGRTNVIVNTDYEAMGSLVAASDCVVLFYEDVFQSAVATQAIWAGLPCVFSDTPGFRLYEGAGLVARDTAQLARAMDEIRRPEVYARCLRQVGILRRLLSPERNAMRYLIGLR